MLQINNVATTLCHQVEVKRVFSPLLGRPNLIIRPLPLEHACSGSDNHNRTMEEVPMFEDAANKYQSNGTRMELCWDADNHSFALAQLRPHKI